MTLPLTPLAHQLAWTGPVPALRRPRPRRRSGRSCATRTPTSTTASAFDRLGIGYYGHRPMPVRAEDIARLDAAEVMPSVLEFTQDDFEEAWRQTQLLLPAL